GGDGPAVAAGGWAGDLAGDDERVVPGGFHRAGQVGKDARAVVMHGAGAAVDGDGVSGDEQAVHLGHDLAAQADAQHGHEAGETLDDGGRHARLCGGAGAGADDDAGGVHGGGFFGGDLVV